MKPTVYIETSVISYLTARPGRDVVIAARQAITSDWWENQSHRFERFISELVEEEISRGDAEAAELRIQKVSGIERLIILQRGGKSRGVSVDRRGGACRERRRCSSYCRCIGAGHGFFADVEL